MSLPGNIGLLSRMPTPSSSQYGNVDGPSSSTDNAVVRWDGATGRLIQNSTVIMTDTGDISIPSTSTAGLQLYNTADQTTNYERGAAYWSGNIFVIGTEKGGSGSNRSPRLTTTSGAVGIYNSSLSSGGILQISGGGGETFTIGNDGSNGNLIRRVNLQVKTNTQTSGTEVAVGISPTYNQASGTAANYDLVVNRTQTAIGSGAQRLASFQVGGTPQFEVDNGGKTAVGAASLSSTTALMTPAGTTGVSSLRIPHGSAPTSPVDGDMWTTTAGLFVRINGSTVGPLS